MIDLRSFITVTLLCLAALPCMAQAPAPPALQVAPALQRAPLKIANRHIIDLRGPIAGYSADDRVKLTTDRIVQILESVPDRTITFKETDEGEGTMVLLAGKPAFLVTGVDINAQIGETTQIVAREAAKRLSTAAREWEEQRQPRYLATATGFAAGATLLFAALLWLLVRGNRWFGTRLSTAAAAHAEKLQVGGAHLFDAAHVLILTRRALSLLCGLLALALASAWLTAVWSSSRIPGRGARSSTATSSSWRRGSPSRSSRRFPACSSWPSSSSQPAAWSGWHRFSSTAWRRAGHTSHGSIPTPCVPRAASSASSWPCSRWRWRTRTCRAPGPRRSRACRCWSA
jgi:hypothetical protein